MNKTERRVKEALDKQRMEIFFLEQDNRIIKMERRLDELEGQVSGEFGVVAAHDKTKAAILYIMKYLNVELGVAERKKTGGE